MKHRSLKTTSFFLSLIFIFSLLPNVLAFTTSATDLETKTTIVDKKVLFNSMRR